jgi:hypothetical protein
MTALCLVRHSTRVEYCYVFVYLSQGVIEHMKQLNHTKLKELDRLNYKKKQGMDKLLQLQVCCVYVMHYTRTIMDAED